MAGRGEELDANEPATAYKLEKARERGQIARSAELTFAAVLLAAVACVYGLGARTLSGLSAVVGNALSLAQRAQTEASISWLLATLAKEALLAAAPLVFVLWLAAAAVSAIQARGVFSAEPLKPDFARLNPATGLKRLFKLRSLFDLARAGLKIAVLGFAMTVWMRASWPALLALSMLPTRELARAATALFASALTVMALLVVLFALLDWAFNRWEFMRNMRMSTREIKDEHKEREGDPRIRARLRELRLEWLKRARQLAQVRNADVLLTNPTHYAVALRYQQEEMPAPMIVARGAGELASRMRKEAGRHRVPIVENAPLARALFALGEAGSHVPQEHFEGVAKVLRWVYANRPAAGGARP
jgi:flagellar biosynthesis protein FlhB